MPSYPSLDTVPATTHAEVFFSDYISKRTPVVVKGLPDDEAFKAQRWINLTYLEEAAGDSEVLIEPMHPTAKQFGTDVDRVSKPFGEFLTELRGDNAEGSYAYLTTQYAAQDPDSDTLTVLPPPADALASDFPRVPRLMGNLFLQQVNLWLGRSKDGATSGLHHDFHDNLYCLLKGKKRFVLYPPEEIAHLYPHGTLDTQHTNGLISYVDAPVRSDGLPFAIALKARVRALEAKLEAMPAGKGKARQNTKERQALLDAHEAALDELTQHALEGMNGVELEDVEDDFDALMAGMGGEEEEEGIPDGLHVSDDEGDDGEDSEEDEEGGPFQFGTKDSIDDDDEGDADPEPSSFSRIPTAFVHQHLNLPTTAILPEDADAEDFPEFKAASTPFVVELNAGDMLYLPASWWHEVTSSSAGADQDDIHMAFNYWFYPPNKLDRFEEPYEDALVWEYFRSRDSQSNRSDVCDAVPRTNGKRKAQSDGESESKKSKHL